MNKFNYSTLISSSKKSRRKLWHCQIQCSHFLDHLFFPLKKKFIWITIQNKVHLVHSLAILKSPLNRLELFFSFFSWPFIYWRDLTICSLEFPTFWILLILSLWSLNMFLLFLWTDRFFFSQITLLGRWCWVFPAANTRWHKMLSCSCFCGVRIDCWVCTY